MELDVKYIKVDNIAPYPFQDTEDGYCTNVDYAFIESVKENGILQPLLVAWAIQTPKLFDIDVNQCSYVCVAGHNRLEAAKRAGLREVPCQVTYYSERISADLHYLESNRFREKNAAEKKAVFFRYKQILCQIAQYKESQGLAQSPKRKGDRVALNNASDEIMDRYAEFLKNIGYNVNGNINSTDVAAKASGMSQKESRFLNRVSNESFIENLVKFWVKSGMSNYESQKILEKWYANKALYESDQILLEDASKEVDLLISQVEKTKKKAAKKEVVKKVKKDRCYLSIPISKEPDHKKNSKLYEKELSGDYEVVNPVSIVEKHEAEHGKKLSWVECMELLIPQMKTCKYIAVRGNDQSIDESVGVRIERVVGEVLLMKAV